MDQNDEQRIIKIFHELKSQNVIAARRELKPMKEGTFKANVYSSNTILYNPSLTGFTDDEIRFSLLHEEGHLTRGQYGIPSILVLIALGLVPLLVFIWSKSDSVVLLILTLCFLLFVLFTSIRILTEPFFWDEYGSDEFAAEILRDKFGIKKPSRVVKETLEKLPHMFDREKLYARLIIAFIEYHPSDTQRVHNIAILFDEE